MNFRALAIVLLAGTIPSLIAQEGDYQKGLSHYKQGQYQKTIEEFEKIIEVHPDYESGHRILGDSYLKIKAYDKAIEAFQNALELKGDNYVTHYGLALSFFNEGRYREAIAALNEGENYARSPRDQYQIYRTRGSAYYNINDFERAISDLQKAVSIQKRKCQRCSAIRNCLLPLWELLGSGEISAAGPGTESTGLWSEALPFPIAVPGGY